MMKKIVLALMITLLCISAAPSGMVSAAGPPVNGFPSLYSVEEVTGYLTAAKMQVMVFPLNKDFFFNYYADVARTEPSKVRTYEVSGVELGYSNLYLVPNPDNAKEYLRYTVLYHTTGSRLIAIGLYDKGTLDKDGKYVASEKYFTNNVLTNLASPDAEHSVLGDYYPNKIINDLEASKRILEYQAENGPFVAGREYSMIEILNFEHRDGYVLGKTSNGILVTGGGVCVVVTNWMKILSLTGAEILEKWEHPDGQKYFENPVGASALPIAATDATVQWPKYDLRWVQKETGWVTASAVVMPDGDELESEYGEETIKFDALEIITLRFTKTKPDLSTEHLEKLKIAYQAYRDGEAGMVALAGEDSRLIKVTPWKRGDSLSLMLSGIVPEERVSRFASEINSDPFLKSLASLRMYANMVDPANPLEMGTYLKTTPWYPQELERLKDDPKQIAELEAALIHLDNYSNIWPNQKVQCVGMAVIVGAMDNRFTHVGGIKYSYAADLVPTEIRTGEMIMMSSNGLVVKAVNTLDEVRVGDYGVRYDSKTGHIFAVVGRKMINGEVVLLIAAANQASDGRISLFEVDKSNFDVVFGIPDVHKVLILGRGTD